MRIQSNLNHLNNKLLALTWSKKRSVGFTDMTGLRWQTHQQVSWCAWLQFQYLLLINHAIFPPSASIQTFTVHMCGIWHGRTYYCWQMTPQENCLKHRLHRWWIATVIALVLFSFPFTWRRITTGNLNLRTLQDLSLLSKNSPKSPQWLCHSSVTSMTAVPRQFPSQLHREIWEFWYPGVTRGS